MLASFADFFRLRGTTDDPDEICTRYLRRDRAAFICMNFRALFSFVYSVSEPDENSRDYSTRAFVG